MSQPPSVLCGYYHEVIQDLGRKLKEEKARNSIETSIEANDISAELKELKDLVDVDGFNAKGDKPTGLLSQTNWDTSDRSVPWNVINGVVEADALEIAAAAANAADVSGDINDACLDSLLFTQVEAEAEEKEAEFKLVTAKRGISAGSATGSCGQEGPAMS
jgi:hypothetical protein